MTSPSETRADTSRSTQRVKAPAVWRGPFPALTVADFRTGGECRRGRWCRLLAHKLLRPNRL